ncbi:TPA: hypothetical protein N0F65_010156 [Lagenidium giganteum]|uniref:cellulose 1,4-beta-cellobiosidase (non-reducing end) n=1 Tax=Lagenidium giganteum TaxID=4803 RepID=A0AAV2Z5W4_9STRA|nr:TPA: hypothetical protein N0F65_010156 [Lagenidium giganteum]
MWAPSMWKYVIAVVGLPHLLLAQQAGKVTPEVHPSLSFAVCTKTGGCTPQPTKVVLDANWRWLHKVGNYENCFEGYFNPDLCPDPETCSTNCALEGADYANTYGVTTAGSELSLRFLTTSNRGSRLYLLQDDDTYQHFKLLNREFTFDVDASELPCGMNGALYFVEMDADGGKGRFPSNKAGAKFGTGYCDAQCPRDIKFINGEANMLGWTKPGVHQGSHGSCCPEFDVWEANSMATTLTPHACSRDGQTRCTGDSCNTCDREGCDFNPFRVGNEEFYGPGKLVDSKRKVTVVTRFVTDDNTDDGKLAAIQRWYVQGGKVIENTYTSVSGVDSTNELTDKFCHQVKDTFSQHNKHGALGGLAQMGEALRRGVVLTLSVWGDYSSKMHWLDSTLPADQPNAPGAKRGSCPTSGGHPDDLVKNHPDARVKFSNIKVGEFGSTTDVDLTPVVSKEPTAAPTPTPTPALDETSGPAPALATDATLPSSDVSGTPSISTQHLLNATNSSATIHEETHESMIVFPNAPDQKPIDKPLENVTASEAAAASSSEAQSVKNVGFNGTTVASSSEAQSAKNIGFNGTTVASSSSSSEAQSAKNIGFNGTTVASSSEAQSVKNIGFNDKTVASSSEAQSAKNIGFNGTTVASPSEAQSVKNIGFNDKTVGADATMNGNSKLAVRTPSASSDTPAVPSNGRGTTSGAGSPQESLPAAKASQGKPEQQALSAGSPHVTSSKGSEQNLKQQQLTPTSDNNSNGAEAVRAAGNAHNSQQSSQAVVSPPPTGNTPGRDSTASARDHDKATHQGEKPAC